ncbi:MAG: exo-alpha-sialidase [Kiritimatiellae bacterium]|nr:exo-alpha-sialidase [Kiritimatiellia bacterium]
MSAVFLPPAPEAPARGKRAASPGLHAATPGILAMPSGRLLCAVELSGPDAKKLPGRRAQEAGRWFQGRVCASDDDGATWKVVAYCPFRGSSVFRALGDVYVLGTLDGAAWAMRSPDGGMSWSDPAEVFPRAGLVLATQRPAHWANRLFLAAQIASASSDPHAPAPKGIALLSAPDGVNLLQRKAWRLSPAAEGLSRLLPAISPGLAAVPFGSRPPAWNALAATVAPAGKFGFLKEETLVVTGASHLGRCHWSAFLVSDGEGAPRPAALGDGRSWAFFPRPGGHAEADWFFDTPSGKWFAVGDAEAAAVSPDGLPRAGLALYESLNALDWRRVRRIAPPGSRRPRAAVKGDTLFVAHTTAEGGVDVARVEAFRKEEK